MKRRKIAVSLNLDWPLKRYHDLYKGIQDYAEKFTDWNIFWDHFPENELLNSKDTPFYDGIIGRIKYSAYREAVRYKIPMVNTQLNNEIVGIPSVYPDYTKIGSIASKYMLNRGFDKFVSLEYTDDCASDDFLDGIKSEISKHNIHLKEYKIDKNVIDNTALWQSLRNDFKFWVNEWEPPLCIVTSSNSIAPIVTTLCKSLGLKIPEQVALMTAENETVYCETHHPHVSSIDIDFFSIGFKAAKMLHDQLMNRHLEDKVIYIPPGEVVPRESTDTFTVKDEYVKKSMRYILDNISSDLDINEVVKQVPVCRRSLENKFKKELGHSIFEELNQIRVEMTKKLLSESTTKIVKIQQMVGFTTSLKMRRTFSKYTGMSPIEYRKKIKSA